MARLRSARLNDNTLVSQIDDFVGELEGELASIFGFTLDSDITVTPFGCDNSGRLTKDLIRFKRAANLAGAGNDPSTSGLKITNSTNSVSSIVGISGVECTQDGENLGVLPIFVLGNAYGAGVVYDRDEDFPGLALLLGTGSDLLPYDHIFGALFDSTRQGLVPRGSGSASEYLCSDGQFRVPGRPVEFCELTTPTEDGSSNTTFVEGITETMYWTSEVSDTLGMHAANSVNVTIPTEGNYLVVVSARVVPETPTDGNISLKIMRERAAVQTQWGEVTLPITSDANDMGALNVEAIVPCEVGDTIFATIVYNDGGSGQFYSVPGGVDDAAMTVTRVS